MNIMSKFVMDSDAADISKLPYRTLNTGAKMPGLGIGTFGSDHFALDDIANAVRGVLDTD
jgi:alcohol dehydrogenase (NADP+)